MVFEAVGLFTVESVTICKEVWSSVIGEVLVCRRDRHDPQCCCYMQKHNSSGIRTCIMMYI